MHPIAWLNESAKIDADTHSQLKNQLVDVISLVTTICYTALVVGALFIVVACIGLSVNYTMSKVKHDARRQLLIHSTCAEIEITRRQRR